MRSNPDIVGVYSRHPRRIAGSAAVFPAASKIPDLMAEFGKWLEGEPSTPETATMGHLRLIAIHPFSDRNSRTARLLMNLILLRGGYPPVAIRPEDRMPYLASLERYSNGKDPGEYRVFMFRRLDETLDAYLALLSEN